MEHWTPRQLKQRLEHGQFAGRLLDIREPWEFAICRIEGSEHIPMRQVSAQVHALDPEQEVVVICHHGVRSRFVGQYLERVGFRRVINLSGGLDAWAREVDRTLPTY
jgi:rhodanese-related sulfurtransferase